jgi:transposase-like protein
MAYWMERGPGEEFDYSRFKYLIYDGTYFHKDGCFISLMDGRSQKIISHIYARKEGYKATVGWFREMRARRGLYPLYITMDGERSVMRAIAETWPQAKIQRCLYHIQREGMRWLRSYPKTLAGKALRLLLKTVCQIRTKAERDLFIEAYESWVEAYKDFVLALPRTQVAYKDLKKTMALIKNALPDMFYYLDNPAIHKTTNALEGFYSRLKADYRSHRGLSRKHRISYLSWYCYFKNHG